LKTTPTQEAPTNAVSKDASALKPTPFQQDTGLLSADPMARNLIIGAFVILILVLLGSMFIQKPSDRPPKDDLLG